MKNENYTNQRSLKLNQKKAAQYSGLSFLSAISTPSILTMLNQMGTPLWFSVSLGAICLMSAIYFFLRSSRLNQMIKDNSQQPVEVYTQTQEKPASLRAS